MKKTARLALLALVLSAPVATATTVAHADVYMQNPRGSNNRLGESGGNVLLDLIDWLFG